METAEQGKKKRKLHKTKEMDRDGADEISGVGGVDELGKTSGVEHKEEPVMAEPVKFRKQAEDAYRKQAQQHLEQTKQRAKRVISMLKLCVLAAINDPMQPKNEVTVPIEILGIPSIYFEFNGHNNLLRKYINRWSIKEGFTTEEGAASRWKIKCKKAKTDWCTCIQDDDASAKCPVVGYKLSWHLDFGEQWDIDHPPNLDK